MQGFLHILKKPRNCEVKNTKYAWTNNNLSIPKPKKGSKPRSLNPLIQDLIYAA